MIDLSKPLVGSFSKTVTGIYYVYDAQIASGMCVNSFYSKKKMILILKTKLRVKCSFVTSKTNCPYTVCGHHAKVDLGCVFYCICSNMSLIRFEYTVI